MRRLFLIVLGGALLSAMFAAQEAKQQEVTPTIRVNSRVVALDVMVTDASGKPVLDLKPDELVVEESGKPQKLTSFELIRGGSGELDTLPETIYSNRPEFLAPRGNYTILLVDALNTPFEHMAFGREQLIRYAASQTKPGHRIAVYALDTSLHKLQSFTDDPQLLAAAIEKSGLQSQKTATASPQVTPTVNPGAMAAGGGRGGGGFGRTASLISTLNAFQAGGVAAYNEQVRVGATTAALSALARMMIGIPGRKNLVWLTAGVPITLDVSEMTVTTVLGERPSNDPTAPPPLQREMSYDAYEQNVRQEAARSVKEMASLLQQAQISVYAVDARGLFGSTNQTNAASSGLNSSGLLVMGSEYGGNVAASGKAISDSQANMKTIAQETGGRYYINRNDIDKAVALASEDGGTYYAVSYSPDKKKFDGGFRKIRVSVKRPGLTVRHRTGYYAIDFSKGSKKDKENELAQAVSLSGLAPSTMLMFDARITSSAPAAKTTVPVLFRVPMGNFTIQDAGEKGKKLDLDFVVSAMRNGKMVDSKGSTVATTVTNEQFQQVQEKGLLMQLELTLPPGQYELALAVRDNPTGMIGTLNVPVDLAAPAK
ncbi:MAG TPA: VWA domain-containing protein [Terriglobales bacterium]|nr:VWA domain-containing protein [Terriglobales bacterium]